MRTMNVKAIAAGFAVGLLIPTVAMAALDQTAQNTADIADIRLSLSNRLDALEGRVSSAEASIIVLEVHSHGSAPAPAPSGGGTAPPPAEAPTTSAAPEPTTAPDPEPETPTTSAEPGPDLDALRAAFEAGRSGAIAAGLAACTAPGATHGHSAGHEQGGFTWAQTSAEYRASVCARELAEAWLLSGGCGGWRQFVENGGPCA